MKKLKNLLIIFVLCTIIFVQTQVFASIDNINLSKREYSEEYKNYLKLSEDERAKVIMPLMYDFKTTDTTIKNPIKYANLKATVTERKFNLKDIIPNNVTIKDQQSTNSCWAFATIAALETNLAMTVDDTKVYDFSERHMEYGATREFLNGEINQYGRNKTANQGGNTVVYGVPYLTNGMGAIDEDDMPFENNEDTIDISKIQNKEVKTQVYDTTILASDNTEEIKNQIKNYVKNYGAITVGVSGNSIATEYYKNSTGALYCDDKAKCPMDHAVVIVGWDDDYSKTKFNSLHQPENNGAWIVRNSWGELLLT